MEFMGSEVQEGWLAQIIPSLAEEPKFSLSEIHGSWQ